MKRRKNIVAFERDASYLMQRARMNVRREAYIDALELMRKAVQLAPDNARYGFEYAHLCTVLGQTDTADCVVMALMEKGADTRVCYQRLAVNALARNEMTDAMLLLRESALLSKEDFPEEDAAMLRSLEALQGASLYPTGISRGKKGRMLARYVRCLSTMTALLDTGSTRAARALLAHSGAEAIGREEHARSLEALLDALDGNAEEARRKAEKTLEKPADPDTLGICVQVFARIGDKKRARTLMEEMRVRFPDERYLWMTARIYGDMDMAAEAVKCLEPLVESPSADEDVLHLYSAMLCRMEVSREQMGAGWRMILRRDPHDSAAHYWLEQLQTDDTPRPPKRRTMPEAQTRRLSRANAEDAGMEDALFDIAHTALKVGEDEDEAVAYFARCRTDRRARAELSAALLRRRVSVPMLERLSAQGVCADALCPPLGVVGADAYPRNAQERMLARCMRDDLWFDYHLNRGRDTAASLQALHAQSGLQHKLLRDNNARLMVLLWQTLHARGIPVKLETLCRKYRANPRKAAHYRRVMMEGKNVENH